MKTTWIILFFCWGFIFYQVESSYSAVTDRAHGVWQVSTAEAEFQEIISMELCEVTQNKVTPEVSNFQIKIYDTSGNFIGNVNSTDSSGFRMLKNADLVCQTGEEFIYIMNNLGPGIYGKEPPLNVTDDQ